MTGGVFDVELVDKRSGFVSILVKGEGAEETFANESGGHRWQRIPPTEKRGRVQSSTVTVAVLGLLDDHIEVNESDIEIKTTRGSGPGGQNKNKTETCVVVTHVPSKTTVRVDMRSQYQSKQTALRILRAKLKQDIRDAAAAERHSDRKQQVGLGMRGDKIRTYRTKENQITDHRSGEKMKLTKWLKGEW